MQETLIPFVAFLTTALCLLIPFYLRYLSGVKKMDTLSRLARRADSTEAFARLVRLHQSNIRGFLRRLCRHQQTADDLAQDVFEIAYRRLGQFSGSGSFSGWC